MSTMTQTKNKTIHWRRIVTIFIFLAVAIALAIFSYQTILGLVSTWDITSLPGLAIRTPTPTPEPGSEAEVPSEPVQVEPSAPTGPTPEPWDGASRVTLLLMGLDYNDWRAGDGTPRTDMMMLLTLDPLSMTAGMLSIPRDLWVSIPGFNYGKINTAYQLGESWDLPGGGPGLAVDTVERLIGVPIQYYAQVDFTAFVRFIDEIGGVKIEVPAEIYVDIYDDQKEGGVWVHSGTQLLPGDLALAYARARHTEGGDFDRAQRQQQIVIGIRDQLLRWNLIPTLVSKAPVLYQELSSGINTNLSLDQVIQLAWLAQQIPAEKIYQRVIGSEQINFGKSPDGLDVLKPMPDRIRELRDQIFTLPAEVSLVSQNGADAQSLMVQENARVSILNGTNTSGLAGLTAEYLQGLGVNVQNIGDAADKPYTYTNIYDHTGNPYTVKYLVELMNISPFRIFSRFDPEKDVDVTVIIGNEWANSNPMP
jgi:LCP family protein required for cell wall assembly